MNIDSVLGDLEDFDLTANNPPILEELNRLDHRAFEMALLVSKDPEQRALLKEEAAGLIELLEDLAEDLEQNHPDLYEQAADKVSESIMDLAFVEAETDAVSLRLGGLLF